MHIYFSGRLLTANDLSAEQQANIHRGASSVAPSASPDHLSETLLHALPASVLDTVALNPQPLPPKDQPAVTNFVPIGWLHRAAGGQTAVVPAAIRPTHEIAPDPVGEVPQEMQRRLQKYLDAYSKCFETVSNALAKISSTSDSITQNLK